MRAGRVLALAGALAVLGGPAGAQLVNVSGAVRDSADGHLLTGAIVEMRSGSTVQSVRTDDAGEFHVRGMERGPGSIRVRRLGYTEMSQDIIVSGSDIPMVFRMSRNAQRLAPMVVGAKGSGIYGIVGSSTDYKPIAGVKVFVAGGNRSAITDSAGEYFIPLERYGPFVLRFTTPGYAEDILPVTVKKNEVIEASRLLDASDQKSVLGGLWRDFDERLRIRGPNSVLMTGSELRHAGGTILDAIKFSPSFVQKGLRFNGTICVVINGIARPEGDLDQARIEDIQSMEVYADDKWDRAVVELARLWPSNVPCGVPGGSGRARSGSVPPNGLAKWFVIWTKH